MGAVVEWGEPTELIREMPCALLYCMGTTQPVWAQPIGMYGLSLSVHTSALRSHVDDKHQPHDEV